jgi:hypothetical protein
MKQIVFWQFNHMGLGSLWQELSYMLSTQESPIEIVTHFNQEYFDRLKTCIEECFAKSKYNIKLIQKDEINYGDCYEWNHYNWELTSAQIKSELEQTHGYIFNNIIGYNCNVQHEYYPVKYTIEKNNFIAIDLKFTDTKSLPKPRHHYDHKEIDHTLRHLIFDYLDYKKINYFDLSNANYSLPHCCEMMSKSFCYIGREGGWSHVSHSAKKDFYPLMHISDRVINGINKAHAGGNKYLKKLTDASDYKLLIDGIANEML